MFQFISGRACKVGKTDIFSLCSQQLLYFFVFDKNNAQPIWYSLTDDLPVSMPHEQWAFIRYSMNLIAEKVAHQAYNEVRILLDKTKKYQQKEARSFLPSDTRFGAEMLYNRMNFTRPLAMFSLTIGILSFFLYCWKMAKQRNSSKKQNSILLAMLGIVFIYLMILIGLRGFIGGHLPISNVLIRVL